MNRSLVSFPVLIAALLLCFQLASGQQSSAISGDQSAEAAALREKAFALLESLSDQLGSLQSAENRARMGSNIAGSLWPHDEKRARALFKLVEEDIKLGLQIEKGTPNAEHTFQVFLKLREDTLARMAQRDPELAFAFLKDTVSSVEEYTRRPDGQIPAAIAAKEHELELRLAKQIGAGDPEIAIKLARKSLAIGLSQDLLPVLRKSSKDKAQAAALYKEIVDKLRDADFGNWQTFEFAQLLVLGYTPPTADESTFRELLQVLLTKAFAGGCANPRSEHDDARMWFCAEVASLMPLFERFYPAEARRLRHWLAGPEDYRLAQRSAYAELNQLAEEGSIDELLSLASKYPSMEGNIRLRAMGMAESTGDWERAEKIASSYSGDPQIQQVLDDRITYYRNLVSGAEQEWATALKQTSNLPLNVRTNLLLGLAHNIALRDKNTALKALAELSSFIDMLPPGQEQTVQQILLATVYSLAKSDRGFAIMEGLLPKLNELIAAGAKLDGYDSRYLRDGEWNMTGEGAVGNILTLLANNAAYFAWSDFDRAVTLAGQFERSEIRMMAQLKLAQGILTGPPKRAINNRSLY